MKIIAWKEDLTLSDALFTLAQYDRDRADVEHAFDELKNQWGWGGLHNQGSETVLAHATPNCLIDKYWSMFVRLAIPWRHAEAIMSRPLLLTAVGTQTRQTQLGFVKFKTSSTNS